MFQNELYVECKEKTHMEVCEMGNRYLERIPSCFIERMENVAKHIVMEKAC